MEGLGGLEVITLCEAKVDQDGHVLIREEDIGGPAFVSTVVSTQSLQARCVRALHT